jgi:hypothetical protein
MNMTPYFQQDGVTLYHGDCREILQGLPDESVSAIVTDPPYGLAFMGKKWDYDVPAVEVWAECLRALKPGGHLLAFAGTRTQHRMAVRIEDAGFEIRDMIAWVYSTGFPKSHNFGCKCSRDALPYNHEENLPREPKAKRDLHPLRDSDVSPSSDIGEGRGEVLQPGVSQSGASIEGREELSASKIRGGESSMEGRRDLLAETRELQADQVCPVSCGVSAYGSEGRLHNGASSDNGADNGSLPIEDRSCASCEPRPAGQPTGESGVVPKQRGAQERGVEADQVCEKCGKLAQWAGWGTALKPAMEMITVARKPLCGTVAENVLQHGTGGLNVDGCRIATVDNLNGGGYSGGTPKTMFSGLGRLQPDEFVQPQGRWPANLIHDGSEEVVALLGEAARFFYTAKADKSDRGPGNNHPTVKPVDLMRYLVRLVCPIGGVVLDPFSGSGTTLAAAQAEGCLAIGVEREAAYCEIIKGRFHQRRLF